MIFFKSIYIENFGSIKTNQIYFKRQGVNLIRGNRETGKTQTIGAIIYSIIGKPAVDFNVNSKLSSRVKLELSNSIKSQKIESIALNKGGKQFIKQGTNPLETELQITLEDSLSNKRAPNLYFNNYQITEKISQQDLLDFETRVPNLTKYHRWKNIKDDFFKERALVSMGMAFLLKLVSYCIDHQKSIIKFPLLIDYGTSFIDSEAEEFMNSIFFELGKTHQVIYTSFKLPNNKDLIEGHAPIIELQANKERPISPIKYNDNLPFKSKAVKGRTQASVRVVSGALSEIQERPLYEVPSLVRSDLPLGTAAEGEKVYDVFISHASEDKEEIVRSLAQALISEGLEVWFDEIALKIGDSLSQMIDKGLSNSRIGLVVLSPSFIKNAWTNYELNGIVTRAVSGEQILLPLWHNITKQQVVDFSPTIADKVARSTATHTVEEIAKEISDLLKTKS